MKILCVGRHRFLSEHFGRFFSALGTDASVATGLENAVMIARDLSPDVVVCDYDLLATLSLEAWEQDELLSRVPVIAVSLSRRPNEVHLLDVNGIGGFLYLPRLSQHDALKMLNAAAARKSRTLRSMYVAPHLGPDPLRQYQLH